MHSHSYRSRLHPSVRAVILAVYACFAIFGLALHHWSGGHRHADGVQATCGGHGDDCHRHVLSNTSASPAEHSCCHSSEGRVTHRTSEPQSKASVDRSSIGGEPSACQGCEQWSSIVQSSSSLASVETFRCDLRIDWSAESVLRLAGLFAVDWNSRAPPVANPWS
jgi:hypothetical protein